MNDRELRELIGGALADMPQVTVPGIAWGACDISYEPRYRDKYTHGIAVIIPFYRMMTLEDYSESEFALLEMTTYRMRLEVGNALAQAFTRAGVPFEIPVVPKDHDVVFRVPLSVKEIAVRAGLGWIGKNDLLVTEKYGPRISMVGLVVRAPELSVGVPVRESRCGDCDACVRACPYGNLTGADWHPALPREELVNYRRCSEKRALFKPKLGRKLACGKCIAACPYGAGQAASRPL